MGATKGRETRKVHAPAISDFSEYKSHLMVLFKREATGLDGIAALRREQPMKLKRKIVKIDQEKCNGCGECVSACVEGAIRIEGGKARLVSDTYCDGLGACLGHCPQDAITIEEREAEAFDEAVVQKAHATHGPAAGATPRPAPFPASPCACPGAAQRTIQRPTTTCPAGGPTEGPASELRNWPVQLGLVSPNAPYLQGADLLLVADCVPFAHGRFHQDFLRGGRPVVIACPKLDIAMPHLPKLTQILVDAQPRSVTVVRMEVPCCGGLTRMAQAAVVAAGVAVPITEITIAIQGGIIREAQVS